MYSNMFSCFKWDTTSLANSIFLISTLILRCTCKIPQILFRLFIITSYVPCPLTVGRRSLWISFGPSTVTCAYRTLYFFSFSAFSGVKRYPFVIIPAWYWSSFSSHKAIICSDRLSMTDIPKRGSPPNQVTLMFFTPSKWDLIKFINAICVSPSIRELP